MKMWELIPLALTIALNFCEIQAQFSFLGQKVRPPLDQKQSQQLLGQPPGLSSLVNQPLDLQPLGLNSLFPLANNFADWVNKNKAETWQVGQSFHNQISKDFLKKLGGSVHRRPYEDLRGFTVLNDTKPEALVLPENFDARQKWPNCPSIKEVSSQGSCGSCWAISSTDVLTDRTCILSQGKEKYRYSAQDLMTCCTDCGTGCDGGDPYFAYDYWINNGIVSGGYNSSYYQGCLQYNVSQCGSEKVDSDKSDCDLENIATPACMRACEGSYAVPYQNDLFKGEKAYNISTVDDAMYELVTKGPINAIMLVYPDLFVYKSGVYQVTPGTESLGGHAIRIIGYGVENGVLYWLCANSWNTNWGENGFFKIIRGKNECGIEDYLLSGIPKLIKQ